MALQAPADHAQKKTAAHFHRRDRHATLGQEDHYSNRGLADRRARAAPAASMASRTWQPLWADRLSMMTMSPGLRDGIFREEFGESAIVALRDAIIAGKLNHNKDGQPISQLLLASFVSEVARAGNWVGWLHRILKRLRNRKGG